MLTADQLDSLTDPIVALYSEYEQSVINDIARRLSKMGMSSASAWQMQRLIESGGVYKNAIAQIAKLTGQSEKDLRAMFEKAGVKSMKFDDSVYKAAGLNPLPLNMSPAMAQVLAAGLRKTQGILSNLTLTTAMSGQQAFIKAADMAYLQVSTGAMSYDQAIRYAVKQMADGGLKVVNYASGHVDKIDVATRRAVLTGVSQTTGKLQMMRADQMGVDLVQTSAHGGARPSHQLWQGKIFSRSGTNKKYPDFVTETGYGTGPGLMGWNCRHSFFPFFEGISENAYNQATLDDYASTTVKLNGQDVPMYDATQYQRGIERKIRYWKRQADALGAAGQDNSFESAKVKQWQERMRAFVKETGLYRQPAREKVYLKKMNGIPAPVVVKPVEVVSPVKVESPKIISRAKGIPVSDALDITGITNVETKREVELALQTINKIHGDGKLPAIPIKDVGAGKNYGVMHTLRINDKAVDISISPKGDHKALTTLHEIGHFIDNSGTPGNIWSSKIAGIENNVIIEIVHKSDWYANFWKNFKDLNSSPAQNGYRIKITRKYANYLLEPGEIFARAYAQYIASESGDPVLLAQLNKLQEAIFSNQWSEQDFRPIAEEFRRLFKQRGWTE